MQPFFKEIASYYSSSRGPRVERLGFETMSCYQHHVCEKGGGEAEAGLDRTENLQRKSHSPRLASTEAFLPCFFTAGERMLSVDSIPGYLEKMIPTFLMTVGK